MGLDEIAECKMVGVDAATIAHLLEPETLVDAILRLVQDGTLDANETLGQLRVLARDVEGCVKTPVDRILKKAENLGWIDYVILLQGLLDEAQGRGVKVIITGDIRQPGGYRVSVKKVS